MKRRYLSLLCLLLSLLMLTSALTACKNDAEGAGESGQETGSASDTATSALEKALSIVVSGKSDYKVICPEESSTSLMGAVNNLKSAINNYTGADIKYDRDFLRRGEEADPNAKEILVGLTNRPESETVHDTLASDEYKICIEGNKLVIVGYSEKDTISAVTYFISKFINGNKELSYGKTDGSLSIKESDAYHKTSEYYIKKITVDGTALSDYTIVIPEGGYVEEVVAKMLNRHLALYYGAVLPIVYDTEAKGEHELRIGKTNRYTGTLADDKYSVTVGKSCIDAVAGSAYANLSLIDALRYDIFKSTLSEIELTDGKQWSGTDANIPESVSDRGGVRVMYHNAWGYSSYSGSESKPVSNRARVSLSVYQELCPDVFCFEEFGSLYRNASEADELMAWLGENYTEIEGKLIGGTRNPIFYDGDRLECLASGYTQASSVFDNGTTWAVFKVKGTDNIFGVTNSHFAANSNVTGYESMNEAELNAQGDAIRTENARAALSAIEKIKVVNGVPSDVVVFTGGDLNSIAGSTPINTLTAGTSATGALADVRAVAAKTDDASAHHQEPSYNAEYDYYDVAPVTTSSAAGAIDFIFVSGDYSASMTLDRYDVLSDPLSSSISDHSPQIVDFTFK